MIHRQSFFFVGALLIILGLSMFFSVAWSLFYKDGDLVPLLQSILVTISFGIILVLLFRNKDKIELDQKKTEFLTEKLTKAFDDAIINTQDGIKLSWENLWIHLRKSNTEPIIRIYAEASNIQEATKLINKIKSFIK